MPKGRQAATATGLHFQSFKNPPVFTVFYLLPGGDTVKFPDQTYHQSIGIDVHLQVPGIRAIQVVQV
jgi:hypothetical protein